MRSLIIGGLIILLICSLVGGLIHISMDNQAIRERAKGICVVVSNKADDECKEIVNSAMNMTTQDFEKYVSNAKENL